MKKMLIVFVLMFVLINVYETRSNFTLKDYFTGDYCYYTKEDVSANSQNLGFAYLNVGTQLNKSSKVLVGESVSVKNLEIESALKSLKAKVVKTEYLDDGTIVIYAYTKLINKQVQVDNKFVNIQIAEKDGNSVVGWPLILGSF